MRILSLDVQQFGCIKKAHLEFGHGLSVLYGPNDIGKSTLVQAIRAVLLLPHTSRAFEAYVPWSEPEAVPQVALTLETLEGGSPRFYRVRKRFGQSSHLEWSHDGRCFTHDKAARQVDERLRQLLGWGLPAAGSGRGMPDSFLAKVLLASQPEVTGVLAAALSDDRDPSGKTQIGAALQAMAEDPLFKQVLDRTLDRVAEAFSSTGRKRRGRDSPWVAAGERVTQARDEVSKLQALRDRSASAVSAVQRLDEQVLARESDLAEAQRHLSACRERWEQQEAVARLRERMQAAQKEWETQLGRGQALEEARATERRLSARVAQAEQAEHAAREAASVASQAHRAAALRVQELSSTDAARQLQLKESQLREKSARIRADIEGLRRESELAQAVGAQEHELTQLEATAAELLEREHRQERELNELKAQNEACAAELSGVEFAQQSQRVLEAKAELARTQRARQAQLAQRQEAAELQARADALEASVAQQRLPCEEAMQSARTLHRQLEVLQAALALGVTATLVPNGSVRVAVVADEGEGESHTATLAQPAVFRGKQSLELRLPSATVAVRVGDADRVKELDRLRQRWRGEVLPWLQATGAASLAQLEARQAEAHATRRECARLRRAAQERQQAAEREPRWADRVGELEAGVEAARQALAELDGAATRQIASRYEGLPDLAQAAAQLRRSSRGLAVSTAEAAERLHTFRAQGAATRGRLDAARAAYEHATQQVPGPWACRAHRAQASLNALEAEQRALETELAQGSRGQQQLASAEQLSTQRERAAALASAEHEAASSERHACEKQLDEHRGLVKALAAAAESSDPVRCQQGLETARVAYEQAERACPGRGTFLSKQAIEGAEAAVAKAQEALQAQRTARDVARGAMMEVGGTVVEEELGEAQQALELRQRELEELELEYGAWQLLESTLREAEQAEATNLGAALGAPLQARFAELTGGRYSRVNIGSELTTEGFIAAGSARSVQALSAGTQEQLSTLFRLCLAEALRTVVILDDHLSQTDSGKMQWFRNALDHAATRSQVIVISCWPEHYQLPPGQTDTATKVDVSELIERY